MGTINSSWIREMLCSGGHAVTNWLASRYLDAVEAPSGVCSPQFWRYLKCSERWANIVRCYRDNFYTTGYRLIKFPV